MSDDGVNADRCRFLIAATSVVSTAEAADTTVPFVGSWFPSTKAKATGAPVQMNVGEIGLGQQIITEWRDKPVFIVHRTKEMLDALPSLEGQLADPDSKVSEQPGYVDPRLRSIKPKLAMIVGICTYLGCLPTFRPGVAPADLGPDWKGGYFYPYHSPHYDLAGHVYKGQLVPLNLPVPPYTFDADDVIIIGVGREKA